jgi:hypothetical protein
MILDARLIVVAVLLAIVPTTRRELTSGSRSAGAWRPWPGPWARPTRCGASAGRCSGLKDLAVCTPLAAGPFVALLALRVVAHVIPEHGKPPSPVAVVKSIAWCLALHLPGAFDGGANRKADAYWY